MNPSVMLDIFSSVFLISWFIKNLQNELWQVKQYSKVMSNKNILLFIYDTKTTLICDFFDIEVPILSFSVGYDSLTVIFFPVICYLSQIICF